MPSGLAYEGKKVLVHAIANFITLRCYEQIRLNICAMNIPVTIVGVGSGFSYDDSGPTHHTVEDITVLRALPRLKIHNMTDANMAKAFAKISIEADYPCYVRLDRKVFDNIYDEKDDFSLGYHTFSEGEDICLVATGNMVHTALGIKNNLKKQGIDIGVIDIYTIPTSEDKVANELKKYKRIITLEEHQLRGGFGSYVTEIMADHEILIPTNRLGLSFDDGYCYRYGGREHMQSLYNLDMESIQSFVIEKLKEC